MENCKYKGFYGTILTFKVHHKLGKNHGSQPHHPTKAGAEARKAKRHYGSIPWVRPTASWSLALQDTSVLDISSGLVIDITLGLVI